MEAFNVGQMHYRQEMIRCGKKTCKSCPHGPYWYAYDYMRIWLKKRYVGKNLPAELDALRKATRTTAPFEKDEKNGPDLS